ncbi:agmatine deiminase family protein [Embleya hyalina]|uniref:Porphyromonas-type peptidyl-arginine deiminase n=1 Tax=Embleya hyalina TaxID=516124 RepID=A0A401YM72_9ACTN|nr:agmatine deiminase family protein [Embleya hyalina]GCD95695.1 Porphyromonas-type peptidyl-arginine deiminase [Embleya hyalina]
MPDNSLSRRSLLRHLTGAGAVLLGVAACSDSGGGDTSSGPTPTTPRGSASGSPSGVRFGAEWDGHTRTFMSWPASTGIWGSELPGVRQDIARVARAVAAHEAVVVLARPDQVGAARQACGNDVEVVPIGVDDLWARDTVSVFVERDGKVSGVDFNFNGWGDKQQHANDAKVAGAVLTRYGLPRDRTWLVAEGGSFETDGRGTLMVTESSVVNANRNPGKSRQEIEDELKRVLGVTTVIWFAGVRGEDITDAHVDSLARFAASGAVLLDKAFPGMPADSWSRAADQARSVLSKATDARGKAIEIVELPQPDPDLMTGTGKDFVSTYANFYVANGAVFMPKFGDAKADDRARQILRDHFPGREIVPVQIDFIASGGGGIHCSTHDQPGPAAP